MRYTLLRLSVCVLLLHLSLSTTTSAVVTTLYIKGGIAYNITSSSDLTVEVYEWNGYKGDIKIPDAVELLGITYRVTSISRYAFRGCREVSSVIIPNSVTSIGNYAFEGCTNMTSAIIGDGVISIGEYAFANCTNLTSLSIGDGLKTLEKGFFYKCTALTSLIIGKSITNIDSSIFQDCNSLSFIKLRSPIPPEISNINVNTIEVPVGSTLKYVKAKGWSNTVNIYAKDGDVVYCPILPNETIGEELIKIVGMKDEGIEAQSNKAIEVQLLNNSLLNYSVVMKGRSEITNLFNDGKYYLYPVTQYKENTITTYAYSQSKYNVTNSGTLIDLVGIDNLENIFCLKLSGNLNGTDILTIRKMSNLYMLDLREANIVNGGATYYDNYTTSENKIGFRFFDGNLKLKKIFLPESVNTIGHAAFLQKRNLATVIIPNSVTSIESYAFSQCTSLTSVMMGNNVSSIGDNAFTGCTNMLSITIPNSVTSIGNGAFERCTSLLSIAIPNKVTIVEGYLLHNCSSLTSVEMSNNVTSIGSSAFEGCSSLISVAMSNNITSIGYSAFKGCTSLKSIIIPSTVTDIDHDAFRECGNLISVTSLNTTPPKVNSPFPSDTYRDGVLYVPKGCRTVYWINPYWENFKNIVELDDTRVNDITVKQSRIIDGVYTLEGVLVSSIGDNINDLPKGAYIINGKKVIIRQK